MTRIELVNIESLSDFFAQLEGQLELEYEMGTTPDALYDVLTTEGDGPVEVIWHDHDLARIALGDWFARLVDVLNTAALDRDDLTVSLQ